MDFSNVSAGQMRSLLYPGATTKILAHYMPWFGTSNHMNVGYSSDDPAIVHQQLAEMARRGIDGVVIDYYGSKLPHFACTKLIAHEIECHTDGNMILVLDFDKGICGTTDPTGDMIAAIKQARDLFMVPSTTYAKTKDGRFLAMEFGWETVTGLDIAKVTAAFPDIAFIMRNKGGYSRPGSAGGYAWMDTSNPVSYYTDFYGASFPGKITAGAVFAGFDDRKAAWSQNRVVDGRQGQLFLDTFAEINKKFSTANQLDWLQLATWNDYEEGTMLEPGIDSGLTVSAINVAGKIQFNINGNMNTVQSLGLTVNGTPLPTPPVSTQVNVDLTSLYKDAGDYTVQLAVYSKAGFLNKFSAAVKSSLVVKPVWVP